MMPAAATEPARLLAYYLPQFHPIPENDLWWGPGFTEWTNTAKARPLFRGHYQPHIPADLGFYDLRLEETREAQAELARSHGVGGFCYYHYWFGGKRLLERPFNEVLASGRPDFPLCLCWANETWTGIWHGEPRKVLQEQTYPGEADHHAHFEFVAQAFEDPRYVRVDGKPLFLVYKPMQIPDGQKFLDLWRELAVKRGFPGIHFVGVHAYAYWDHAKHGYDAVTVPNVHEGLPKRMLFKILKQKAQRAAGLPVLRSYTDVQRALEMVYSAGTHFYPTALPNWDNTPRSGKRGFVVLGATPEAFRGQLRGALSAVADRPWDDRLVFLKSWNEWAEGNHLEPDLKYGKAYLQVIREELDRMNAQL
ncbi:MAG TPA: glycoside hydrolase family 99-like domain-containing protein [Fimbriimonadaceae bacterium]|nr:glycoside hydrolase family 99-like domain-containing protein [Fimbriimonadaceae bacterium]